MKVITAKTAGFCMGVARAVRLVEEALERGEKLHTLGPLIHNPQMTARLEERGVIPIEDISQALPGYRVVLRSHGVPRALYEELDARGIPWLDATCPYVKKIQDIVRTAGEEGKISILVGNPDHPEVQGICGHCPGDIHVVRNAEELEQFLQGQQTSVKKDYILAAQTTLKLLEWQKCIETTKKLCTNAAVFGTICNATALRQNEILELSKQVDAVVVVGGRGSSNTRALWQIASQHGPAYLVETAKELRAEDFAGFQSVAITAGASTPAFIIKEVQETMSEVANVQDEMSFEEMLEQSFKTIYTKEKVTGIVTSVSPNEIAVDIGTKQAGYVPLHEFTEDPNAKLEDLVKVGDKLELLVLRVNDMEGTAMLSKKRLDAVAGYSKIMEAEKTGEVLEGTVVDVVKGGVIVLSHGVRVFVPASQATLSRGEALEPLLKTKVQFKILETNERRRRAVGSIRAVLKEQRKAMEEKFWQEVEVGKEYNGTVKSLTGYGAFVDLGGVDGMVHISELSWNRIKDPSEVVKVGDKVKVFVKDIDRENKKISLGYKKDEDNPWTILSKQYKVGDVVTVKIVSMTTFGAFAQVIPGVDGLIHISQISTSRIGKPSDVLSVGQEVQAKITDIDLEKKRVSLSIRALLEEARAKEEAAAQEEAPQVLEFGPPQE
ncbi:MAG TPA: bifunctional 4-hydroxy-3-methylbut-2-enyl diphosphate reductase/30S ribosomal protein S1 [Clostridiales bacterium]|nr:bifunctional 4-hydroxy-3-methylbut-2-enyl diphosphate reductase/30S ribosomal protein S1 [Clostridiales bacterium]